MSSTNITLSGLLGPLEARVMEVMWARREGTVREVRSVLQGGTDLAYTTVMTILGNLAGKGLLLRTPQGKAYRYRVALTRDEFLARAVGRDVSQLLDRYGELAIARFVEAAADLDPALLERLRDLAKKPTDRINRKRK